MRLRRIGAITLAAHMTAGTLAGCSAKTATTETTNAQTTAAAETTAASSDAKAASGDKTVINIWSKDRHDASYVQEKVDQYNKTNTDNIQLNYQLYTDNYVQAIDMAVQSGELPDIMV